MLSYEQLQSRKAFSVSFRSDINDEVTRSSNNDNTLWKTARLFIWNISSRFIHSVNPVVFFEFDLHDLWYTLIQAAKITQADDAAQDRLVSQVIYAKEMGTLSRTSPSGDHNESVAETAATSDGIIWGDLPFLVKDLQEAWKNSTTIPPGQQHNLAAFTARLIASGVGSPDLGLCAIWMLRNTLEKPRRLASSDSGSEIPIAELLSASITWFEYCGHKLARLAASNYSFAELPPELSALGELAQNANVTQGGFSVSRWLFWRHRLEEISRTNHEELAKAALRGFNIMKERSREIEFAMVDNQPGLEGHSSSSA